MPQAEQHVVVPEPVVHPGAKFGLDLDVNEERQLLPFDWDLGEEVDLPPVAGRPVGKDLFVKKGRLLKAAAAERNLVPRGGKSRRRKF
jgi:hypothetical protein